MPYTNHTSDWSQALETLVSEQTQIKSDIQRCRCPKCDRFGVVCDTHDYYGTIYRCNCLPVFWVINPETGDRIEEVK